ncbi:hypothetical protein HZH68_007374 [Vespula germanica]|uniref:Hippocampus abundant transcript 1 protein n=2 Tax=Vespula TaxID=7451 RepID=A0A834NB14_VESGE|nr:hypothetical protein HZH68_007374 [Vespula germanica]KAF7425853.1 hypothetical protein H0235_008291 [Vespula pensylvanica]
MPPGAKGGAEGLGPSCSDIHNSQEHAIAKFTPPLTFAQQCYRHLKSSGVGEASVYHALVVIFLEFFAWGLLTMPIISVLNETFPDHTFLMNGLIMGIKGILSFLSAPLIGALSDVWGRKFFLLITVAFTCAPIPLMSINTWWFFAMISISGVFACTFSVVFAYVADVTEENQRSLAYGLVSATFAASMVISPALGAYTMTQYGENLAVALATAIAVLDVFFILVAVPESLPEKARPPAPISWEQADPFAALGKVGKDHTILMLCVTVFLSYLPEAGQYSCIFVYLKLTMGFSAAMVAWFIAVVGILSVGAQIILGPLMRTLGSKHTIMLGLLFEMLQLMWYGFGSQIWMMWAAGVLASVSSITYPAISAFVSMHSDADKQGTGTATQHLDIMPQLVPGPPFVFGALLVICALLVAAFIPETTTMATGALHHPSTSRRPSGKYAYQKCLSLDVHYEPDRMGSGRGKVGPLSPLVDNCNSAAL